MRIATSIFIFILWTTTVFARSIVLRPGILGGLSFNHVKNKDEASLQSRSTTKYSPILSLEYSLSNKYSVEGGLFLNNINYKSSYTVDGSNISYNASRIKVLEVYGMLDKVTNTTLYLAKNKRTSVYLRPIYAAGAGITVCRNLNNTSSGSSFKQGASYSEQELKFRNGSSFGLNVIAKAGLRLYANDHTEICELSVCYNKGFSELVLMDGYYTQSSPVKNNFTLVSRGSYAFVSLSIPITLYRYKK